MEVDAQHRELVISTGLIFRRPLCLPLAAKHFIRPRIRAAGTLVPAAFMRPSSSGLGHRPFTAVTRVRTP